MPARKSKLPLLIDVPLKADFTVLEDQTPKAVWVMITPELAIKWLDETNTNNRTVREDHVARLAADMADGRWRGRNGEAIRFDINGRLVDGQHRLWACIVSNTPFETLLVQGVDINDYSTIGTGVKKSISDFLGPVNGEKNTTLLAGILRLVYLWRNGELSKIKEHSASPTIGQIQQTLADNPKVRDSTAFIANHRGVRLILIPSYGGILHYAGYCEGKQAKVEDFLLRISDGLGLLEDSPAYQLRKFLLTLRSPTPGIRRKVPEYILALAIKAWNAYKDDKPMKTLRLIPGEGFPKL